MLQMDQHLLKEAQNYAYKDLESNGVKVPARDYVVKRGE